MDFQKIRLEISHVFSMIFKHKKENLTGYTTLQKLTSTLDFTVFESNLHKYLAGVDVLFKNLALFAYKLEHYEEVIEISVNFAKELNDFLANKKDLDKFKLKAILKSVNFYDDFIIQKKIILSYFYYLLSKSYEKLKEDDNALDNIKFALEALEDKTHDDKTHDYYKKYNSFFQLIINQMALKHSLDINYDDFKRNLQELDEKNQKQQECSIDFKEKSSFKHLKKEILKNPIGKDNSNAFFKKKKPLAKFLMIAEALPQNKVFFERQKLFNQSLHNCSTTIRNSGSYSIIKSKPSSFHQKFDLSYQKTSMKPSIRFPIDMKSLLLKRPKSANQSNSKHDEKLKKNKKNNNNDNDNDKEKNKNFYEKDREKIRFKEKNNEKHNKNFKDQEFHEKKAALNAEDSIFKVKKNSKNMNEQLSKPTTPQSHSNRKNNQQNLTPDLQPLFHKKLKKAFSTKFNLHEKPKVSSKSFLPNNSRSMNRRYTERPDSFPPKKPELLKLGQNPGHHRFSSMGVSLINYTVVSSNKSPGISSSHVKKASGSVFSNSIESNSEEEVMSGEEETKKDIKNTLPLKLPTISNVGSEETPLNREKNKCEMSLHSYEMETPKEIKSEYNIPFIKV